MCFGVLFDFMENSNVTKFTTAKEMVKEKWFLSAVNYNKPIDLFIVVGHNPIRNTNPASTFGVVLDALKSIRPHVPVQVFRGHSHLRDFQIDNERSSGLNSGQYCKTVGWLSIFGIKSPTYTGNMKPNVKSNQHH